MAGFHIFNGIKKTFLKESNPQKPFSITNNKLQLLFNFTRKGENYIKVHYHPCLSQNLNVTLQILIHPHAAVTIVIDSLIALNNLETMQRIISRHLNDNE